MGMIQGAVLGAAGSVAAAQANIQAAGELKKQQALRIKENEIEGEHLKAAITNNELQQQKGDDKINQLGIDMTSKVQDMYNLESEKPKKGRTKAAIAQDLIKAKMDYEKMKLAHEQANEQMRLTIQQSQEFRDRLDIVEARGKILRGEK